MLLKTTLFEHQQKAVDKLLKVKVGALLMEMGTGKTRSALEIIQKRLEKGKISHIIWLCPCSVKENLRRDIIKHTGRSHSDIITICGIETLSSSIKAYVKLREITINTNCFIIVDESNLIKNYKAKRTERIIELGKLCKYKMILNGTPITRTEADLFSQWYFLDWRILGYQSYYSFAANHLEFDENNPSRIRNTLNVDYLSEKIAPYSYQIRKSECISLPEKHYYTRYFSLTDKQQAHYREVADKLLLQVDEIEPNTIYRLFTGLSNILSGYRVWQDKKKRLRKKPFFDNKYDNPRLDFLLETIDSASYETEKIIIFAKYTHEINDICSALNEKYGAGMAVAFNGELNIKKREKNIESFINEARFFIANKQCGSYGLNLQFCSYIIYYDNDWDYGTRIQSEDRVHRIGQNNNVTIIDICAADTLDERILSSLQNKEDMLESFKDEVDKIKDKSKEELFNIISIPYKSKKPINKHIIKK